MENDIREKMYSLLMDEFEQKPPEKRLQAFVVCLMKDSGAADIEVELYTSLVGAVVLGVLHAADQNPVWVKMVVEDTQFFRELYKDTDFEGSLDRLTTYYPKRVAVPK